MLSYKSYVLSLPRLLVLVLVLIGVIIVQRFYNRLDR